MTTEQQRENAQQIRLALLAAMLDTGNSTEVVRCDYLSAGDSVPATEVDLTEVCGGKTKEIDPYLRLRRGR